MASEVEGLQSILYISPEYAQSVTSSGLFPFPDTGNLTLDTFDVSSRLYTDVGFRCIDQATVYAGALSHAFPSAYFYQFDRAIGGYDPNNVGNPPMAPGYPLGDPHLPYFKVHAGDVESAFGTISPNQIREPQVFCPARVWLLVSIYPISRSESFGRVFESSGLQRDPRGYSNEWVMAARRCR